MTHLLNEIYACKDEQAKERAAKILAQFLDIRLTHQEKSRVAQQIRQAIHGNHFDADSAKERISRMFYVDTDGSIVYAPFISDRNCIELYDDCKEQIKGYNLYDYMVVLNDTIANFHNLLYDWWENEDWCVMLIKFSEVAVNWLNDDDTPFRGEKAWRVLGEER